MKATPSEKSSVNRGAALPVSPAANQGTAALTPRYADSRIDGAGKVRAGGRFRKPSRLLKHADFDCVYRKGKRHFSQNMTVFWRKRDAEVAVTVTTAGPRVGFTVGKVLGGAVVRNRIKRRMREAVRATLSELRVPVDVVINPKKSALTVEFPRLREEVAAAFTAIEQGRQSPKR